MRAQVKLLLLALIVGTSAMIEGCTTYLVSGIGLKAQYGYIQADAPAGSEHSVKLYEGALVTGEPSMPYGFYYLSKERRELGTFPYTEVKNKEGNVVAIHTNLGKLKISHDKAIDPGWTTKEQLLVERKQRSAAGYAAQSLQLIALPLDLVGGLIYSLVYVTTEAFDSL